MIKRRAIGTATALATLALSVMLAVPFFTAGCGGASTPQQAVENFYKAVQDHNWNEYLSSILPDNVRRMTQSDLQNTKKQFESSDYQYKGLKYKTIPDPKDKNKAKVELLSGTIIGTNPSTNQKESTTIAEIKKNYKVTPTINAEKYKGNWYVNVPMASADKEAQPQ